jgi:hypothetical protein
VNRFIGHLHVVTTNNYNTIADFHTLKSLHANSSPSCSAFTSHCLVRASNNGDSSSSCAQVLCSQPPVQNSTELIPPIDLVITSGLGPRRKHRSSILSYVFVAVGMCLPGCCLETAIVYSPLSQSSVELEIQTAMHMEDSVFWHVSSCSLLVIDVSEASTLLQYVFPDDY